MHNSYNQKVTIAIPTYNRADNYLKQTLTSALNQTYQNLEIVVADNCSTDNTESFINSFSDPRIRYFKQKTNILPNDNFNFCLNQARGDYFLLLQDDDLIDRDFVETCMKAVNKHTGIGIIRTGIRVIDSDGKLLNETPNTDEGLSTEELFRKWFAWKSAFYLCSTVFNTRRLQEIGGFQSKHNLFQDVLAEFQLIAKYDRIDVQHIKASFRQHLSSMTSAGKVRYWCEDSIFLLDSICDMVSEKKRSHKKRGAVLFFQIQLFIIQQNQITLGPFSRIFRSF
jgi:glycosyltransferase involved in cell wall biosynthesis